MSVCILCWIYHNFLNCFHKNSNRGHSEHFQTVATEIFVAIYKVTIFLSPCNIHDLAKGIRKQDIRKQENIGTMYTYYYPILLT